MLTISECSVILNEQVTERYRSGHNEAVLKTVCPQGHVGSNPTLSVIFLPKWDSRCESYLFLGRGYNNGGDASIIDTVWFGEVPKLAEGTPLERVQVVNSGARVQIPPSAVTFLLKCTELDTQRTLTTKQQCNPERFLINEIQGYLIWKKFREQNLKQYSRVARKVPCLHEHLTSTAKVQNT